MEFSELLNQIIERTGCTAKELSEISGISPASLSRYRSGERMPEYEQMQKLLQGLKTLIKERGVSDIDEEALQASFTEYMAEVSFDYEQFTERLNMLLSVLEINMTDLARSLNFDASYLSRIRQGQRRPSDRDGFIRGICQYVIRKKSPSAIARLTGDDPAALEKDGEGFQCLYKWLSNGVITETGEMDDFLRKLDTFDLGEYIRAIHFDELKVPSVPFQLPSAKHYYGVEAMKQGELDFFKTTVLSKSRKKVFMCSDMPLADMAEDRDFAKKWMFAIAMTLKKGLHFEIIHNIDRPFKEMMYGLESWIPLYMTGQVAPYYLKGKVSNVYCHFLYVSGAAALCGEAVRGFHDEGQYYLTNKSEEVNYYRKRADRLLEKAQPLMQIYRAENEKNFSAFRQQDAEGFVAAAAHPSSQLVKLGQAESVGVFHHHDGCVGNIDADLHDRRRDQNPNLAVGEAPHNSVLVFSFHPPVQKADLILRENLAFQRIVIGHRGGHIALRFLDEGANDVGLAALVQLLSDKRIRNVPLFRDDGTRLDRLTSRRKLVQNRNVEIAV